MYDETGRRHIKRPVIYLAKVCAADRSKPKFRIDLGQPIDRAESCPPRLES